MKSHSESCSIAFGQSALHDLCFPKNESKKNFLRKDPADDPGKLKPKKIGLSATLEQCYQMGRLWFDIWPFRTVKKLPNINFFKIGFKDFENIPKTSGNLSNNGAISPNLVTLLWSHKLWSYRGSNTGSRTWREFKRIVRLTVKYFSDLDFDTVERWMAMTFPLFDRIYQFVMAKSFGLASSNRFIPNDFYQVSALPHTSTSSNSIFKLAFLRTTTVPVGMCENSNQSVWKLTKNIIDLLKGELH